VRHVLRQVVHLLRQFANLHILRLQLSLQLTNLSVLLLHLLRQVVDGAPQLVALHRTLPQLVAQLVDQLAVLLHGLADKLHLLTDDFGVGHALFRAGYGDALLGFVDGPEALFDVVHRGHHVVDFRILLSDDTVQ